MLKRKTKSQAQPNWRPDFRIVATLPDTKIIRTDFILNFVSITVALLVTGFALFQQIDISTTNASIRNYESKIAELEPSNNKALRESDLFQKDMKKIEELILFMDVPLDPIDLIQTVSANTPRDFIVNSLSYAPQTTTTGGGRSSKRELIYKLEISVTASGQSAEVTRMIDDYRNTLATTTLLKPLLIRSDVSNPTRDDKLGTITQRLSFELKGVQP